jgi:hypothetical protein
MPAIDLVEAIYYAEDGWIVNRHAQAVDLPGPKTSCAGEDARVSRSRSSIARVLSAAAD